MGCCNQGNYGNQCGGSSQGGCSQCGGSSQGGYGQSSGGSNCGCQPVSNCQWYKCKYTVCQDQYYYKKVCSN